MFAKITRKNALIALVLSFVFFLSACGSKDATLKPGLDLDSLGQQLMTQVEFKDPDLKPLDDKIWNRYVDQVDSSWLNNHLVIAGGGMVAEEICLFEAVDEAKAEEVEKAMKERYEYLKTSFGNYTPEELKNLEAPVLKRVGPYVFSVISAQNEKVETVIDQWIKDQQ
jgi:hypothetical protein